MEKKVQYKFQVEESFADSAKEKNVEFGPSIEHAYTYFESPSSDENSFIVLRIKKSEGVEKLDMKIRNNKTGEWEHFESGIGDANQVQSILERIGCKSIFTFHKHRRTWIGPNIRLDLDTTKELGTFLEVKFDLSERVRAEEFLRSISVDPKTHDKRSVIEIYLEKYQR